MRSSIPARGQRRLYVACLAQSLLRLDGDPVLPAPRTAVLALDGAVGDRNAMTLVSLLRETHNLGCCKLTNGGLGQGIVPSAVVTFAVLVALVEAQGLRIKAAEGDNWLPGDYGSLKVYPRGSAEFYNAAAGEVWNGRIAMIAILAFVVQEAVTKVPTAATIPFF